MCKTTIQQRKIHKLCVSYFLAYPKSHAKLNSLKLKNLDRCRKARIWLSFGSANLHYVEPELTKLGFILKVLKKIYVRVRMENKTMPQRRLNCSILFTGFESNYTVCDYVFIRRSQTLVSMATLVCIILDHFL